MKIEKYKLFSYKIIFLKNALKIHWRVQGTALHCLQDFSWYPRKTSSSLPYQNHPSQSHSNNLHHSWFWLTFRQVLSHWRLLCQKRLRSSSCRPQRIRILRSSKRLCHHRGTWEWRHSLAKTSPIRPSSLPVRTQFGSTRDIQIACLKAINSSKRSNLDQSTVWFPKRQKSSMAQNILRKTYRKRPWRRYCELNGKSDSSY